MEIQSSALMRCSIEEALKSFFLHFHYQMYCRYFEQILHLLFFSDKLQKMFIKVLKTSCFAIVQKSILLSKKCTPQKCICGEGGGGIVSFCMPSGGEQTNRCYLFKRWIILFTQLVSPIFIRCIVIFLVPVVQNLDSTIHRINHYPMDKCQGNQLRYPTFEQLGPWQIELP